MKMRTSVILIFLIIVAGCQVALPTETEPDEVPFEPIDIEDIMEEPEPIEEIVTPDIEAEFTYHGVEGDLIQLKPEAVDPDGDLVYYYFTEPFNENGNWQTIEGDAGQYLVTITATDKKDNTSKDVLVIIAKANKPPVIECPETINVKETELVVIECNIYDPEGDTIVIEYSGFMRESSYVTTYDDAGEYSVVVTAKDKEKASQETVKVIVTDVNRAPTISGVPDEFSLMETEILTVMPVVEDPDGDAVTLTFSEPMNSKGIWKTDIGDSGVHKLSVVASDGEGTTKKEFTVSVSQKNTAPKLKRMLDITVEEGDTINLPIEATDREGDELTITVLGWMNQPTKVTTYDDAGEYTTTVIVSDGEFQDSETISITVIDKNRPPIFKTP
jgi:hypothetical protein